jgi:hypothetical protein
MITAARLVLTTLVLVFTCFSSQSGQATAPPPAPLSPIEQQIAEIKNPAPWVGWGADLRVRNEYINDLITHNPDNPLREQDVFRFRARIWTSVKPVTNLTLNARLATEPRYWVKEAGFTVFRGNTGMDWTEGVVDNLNLQWKDILGQPVALGIGRQDLLLGDGWLVGDGTPADGSWTYFLDSARVTLDLKAQKPRST